MLKLNVWTRFNAHNIVRTTANCRTATRARRGGVRARTFFLLRKRFRWCNTSNWTKVSSSTSNRRHPSTQRNYGITTYGRIEHRRYIMASPIHSFAYISNMTHTLSCSRVALDGNILNRPHTSCTPSHSNVLQWICLCADRLLYYPVPIFFIIIKPNAVAASNAVW